MLDATTLKRLADSQLEHVLIALRNGDRAYNVRDVLDPWWCFVRGDPFVAGRGDGAYTALQFNKPCAWEWRNVLPQFDWLSEGAKAIIDKGQAAQIVDRKNHPDHLRLIVDHSVPLARICEALWASPKSWNIESLRDFLNKCFRRAVISYEENRVLNVAKLASKMPHGWRFGEDPFERYRNASIKSA